MLCERTTLRKRAAYHESGHCTAAIAFAIPIIRVTIADRPHLHRELYHPPDAGFGLECMVTLCLAGPEAEKEFCGPITDNSDRIDYQMAYEYLARQLHPLQVGAELTRYRDAAQRLVRSQWAQQRILRVADSLLQNGSLSAEEIYELAAALASAPLANRLTVVWRCPQEWSNPNDGTLRTLRNATCTRLTCPLCRRMAASRSCPCFWAGPTEPASIWLRGSTQQQR